VRSQVLSTMPESSGHVTRHDRLLVTVLWLAAAAVCWWSVQPGEWLPSGWLGLLGMVWVGLVVRAAIGARSGRVFFVACWVLLAASWLVVLSWVGDISIAGLPPLAVYSAAYSAVGGLLIRWWYRGSKHLPLSVAVGVIGLSLEYIRAEVLFDAWPFYLAGHPLWGSQLAMLASWGGVWACSLLIFACGGAFAGVLLGHAWRVVAWSLIFPAVLIGVALLSPTPIPTGHDPLRVLVVQTNLPQDNKMGWPLDRQQSDIESFLALTASGLAEGSAADLVVWPETMVPGLGFDRPTMAFLDSFGPQADDIARLPRVLIQSAEASGTNWLVGAPTWSGVTLEDSVLTAAHRFNSAVLIGPDGSLQRYDKTFLTPFGETMPYVRSWPWLESLVMDFGARGMRFDLDVGSTWQPLTLSTDAAGQWQLATPICFEAAVPSVTRTLCVEAGRTLVDAMINISNDGWFGASDAGRATHAVAAAFRAVEMGRPLVRVANTGVSGLFLPDASSVGSLPPREAGTLLMNMPRYDGQTLYASWGNWLPRLSLIMLVLGIVIRRVRPAHRVARL
jgi:apolipoprotein N-acyltransferase